MRQIKIKIIPNAPKNKIVGLTGDFLKVKINAQPSKGKANRELIKFLAREFNVSKSEVKIIKGEKGRKKIVEIL
jgi:uncharacterized protein (TIGR00251 family)